jgi:hypothetical protein
MIQTKFGFNWSSSFRGEDFLKSLRRTTDEWTDGRTEGRTNGRTPMDDGRQVMARWAKKGEEVNKKIYF